MFTPMSEKDITFCPVCGSLLRTGRVCKGYDKPLSSKNFPSEGLIWGFPQDTKMGKVIVPSTPPYVPRMSPGFSKDEKEGFPASFGETAFYIVSSWHLFLQHIYTEHMPNIAVGTGDMVVNKKL